MAQLQAVVHVLVGQRVGEPVGGRGVAVGRPVRRPAQVGPAASHRAPREAHVVEQELVGLGFAQVHEEGQVA